MSIRRIGILGGTFDPIHWGHLEAAFAAETALNLMRVMVVPSSLPAHRPQPHASSFHRFAMVALAVGGRAGWRASDLELRDESQSYTSATLDKFHERGYKASELYFILGSDAFADIATWMHYPAILDRAHFVVISRPGHPVDDMPAPAAAARAPDGAPAARRHQPHRPDDRADRRADGRRVIQCDPRAARARRIDRGTGARPGAATH